jgi:hypothetical protein
MVRPIKTMSGKISNALVPPVTMFELQRHPQMEEREMRPISVPDGFPALASGAEALQ